MTTQTEALNIAIDYMNERLEEHDFKYQRHPATEAERNNILADIETVKEALAQRDRHELQAKGEHPAPCARFCEANAFQIEIRDLKSKLAQQSNEQVEPIGEVVTAGVIRWKDKYPSLGTKLYTTPPQRKPLTDEGIDAAIKCAKKVDTGYAGWVRDQRREFARAIEAAHGIKE